MTNNEIGGYFELECYGAQMYHTDVIALNSGRNALKYVIKAYGITEIFAPYYTCPVVWDALCEEGCGIKFYDIDNKFLPTTDFPETAYVLVNDWFGVCGGNIANLDRKYGNLITDNAQSFYAVPKGIGSFYSPRKFFGLPDGGLLISDKRLETELTRDVSYKRVSHLIERYDLGANAGYDDFKANDNSLSNQPIMQMSNLTRALMGNIDYDRIRRIRLENFNYLHNKFSALNELDFDVNAVVCPMVYPLLIKKEGLREKLIASQIYVARYWDAKGYATPKDTYSAYLTEFLLPLPIDQRYGLKDMDRIVRVIKEFL